MRFLVELLERLYSRVSWLWLSGKKEILLLELRAGSSTLSSCRFPHPFWSKSFPTVKELWSAPSGEGSDPSEALARLLATHYTTAEKYPPLAFVLSTHGVRTINADIPPLEVVETWVESNVLRLLKLPIERSEIEVVWHLTGGTGGRAVSIHVARLNELQRVASMVNAIEAKSLGIFAAVEGSEDKTGAQASAALAKAIFFGRAVSWSSGPVDSAQRDVAKTAMQRVVLGLGLASLFLLLVPTLGTTWIQGREDATAETRSELQAMRSATRLLQKEIATVKRETVRLEGRLTVSSMIYYHQKIAEVLPGGLRLTRIAVDKTSADAALVVAGEIRSDVDLVRFIDALDRTGYWSEVRLMRASQSGGATDGGPKTFEIRGRW